jgi:hypothetical protein
MLAGDSSGLTATDIEENTYPIQPSCM